MSKKKEETAVEVKSQTTELALGGGGCGMEDLDSSDILVPRVQLCQAMSKIVKAGDAVEGALINTVTKERIGGFGDAKKTELKAVPFIVVKSFKTWAISEKKQGETKFKFVRTIPMTSENALLPQEETINGVQIQNDRCLNFMLLTEEELAQGSAMPMVLTFKRTSYKAGQVIVSALKRLQMQNPKVNMWDLKFTLSVETKVNDEGDEWVILSVKPGAASTPEERQVAFEWFSILTKNAGNVKMAPEHEDEEDDRDSGLPSEGVKAADGKFEV